MIELGQLRMWQKRADGGQFYNIPEGSICLVIECFDNGKDADGDRPKTFTVLHDGETPWFLETELEEHTVEIDRNTGAILIKPDAI